MRAVRGLQTAEAMRIACLLAVAGLAACDLASDDPDDPLLAEDVHDIQVARATIGGRPVWVHFANPVAHADGRDPTILDEVVRLIRGVPAGGQIRAAIHSLVIDPISTALIDAHHAGVSVRVVEDGSDEHDTDPTPRRLHDALGANHVWCGSRTRTGNHGCITTDPSGIMHTKLFTFSRTTAPDGTVHDDVVWFGSANLTHATGARTFNNTVTVYGDAELYDGLTTYFGQLSAQRHFAGNDFYDASAGRGFVTAPTARIYASPTQHGDLIYNRLNDIHADSRCRIRIAQAMVFDSRPELVDLVVRLKRGGCKVWIAASNVQPASLAKLRAAHIPVRDQIVHDKLVIVDARFAGSARHRKLVFTGSHNWTESANSKNDELFARLEDDALYAAYYHHFGDAFSTGDPR